MGSTTSFPLHTSEIQLGGQAVTDSNLLRMASPFPAGIGMIPPSE